MLRFYQVNSERSHFRLAYFDTVTIISIGVGDRGAGRKGGTLVSPLDINSGKSENIWALNPLFVIFLKTFFWRTLYIWKHFVLNIRADSSCPPNCFALLPWASAADGWGAMVPPGFSNMGQI